MKSMNRFGKSALAFVALGASALSVVPATLASASSSQSMTGSVLSAKDSHGSGGSDHTHPYRHGEVPSRNNGAGNAGGAGTSYGPLVYHGGTTVTGTTSSETIGVTTGTPKVYLVFWGSQWGQQGTTTFNSKTYVSFSNDRSLMAPDLQAFFTGLGTNGESWSGVMTQYCQGVALGSSSCPASAAHVGYPTAAGVLAGVWGDLGAAAPSNATSAQLAAEAVAAAAHFGNSGDAANVSNQYFIVSPSGTHPDGFNTQSGNFCAWHDYTGDPSIAGNTTPVGQEGIAFTNFPYIPDMGTSCGANFVNGGAAGALDGVTIVGGHEYAETLTDQFPGGGWWSATNSGENGDLCAWNSGPGAVAQNISLATGSFAVQPTWGNDGAGTGGLCQISHAIVGASAGPAAKLVLATTPVLSTSGAPFSRQPVVDVTDASGNLVTSDTSTVTVALGTGSPGTLGGSLTATVSGGVASFTNLTYTGSGPITLNFTDGSLTPVSSGSLTVGAAPATKLVVATGPASSAVNGVALSPQPVVDVTDASGNTVVTSNVVVTATITSGSGSLTNASVAASNGVAKFTGLTITGLAGNYTLSFNATGLTSAVAGPVSLTAGAPARLVMVQQPQSQSHTSVLSPAPSVEVLDSGGNLVTSAPTAISVSLARKPFRGAIVSSSTTTVSTVNGVATFSNLLLSSKGTYSLAFKSGSMSVTSNTFSLS